VVTLIIKEFRCLDCGTTFETADADPECPACVTGEPERAFLTPPGIRSSNTGRADQITRELAADFKMSDMSNRQGQAVKQRASQNAAEFAGPQIVQQLNIPNDARDQFSGVANIIQNRGPTTWQKVKDRR